jgi:hypothetical protein
LLTKSGQNKKSGFGSVYLCVLSPIFDFVRFWSTKMCPQRTLKVESFNPKIRTGQEY